MDGGPEKLTDPEEASRLRARARRIYIASIAAALLVTAVGLLLVAM